MKIVTCLLLWLAAFIAYLPTTDYDFVNYDDERILVEHPELYNNAVFLDGVKTILFNDYPREEPLLVRDISWTIDSRLFGFYNPHGYHYGNVFCHALVVVLLFLFLLMATGRYEVALLTAVCFLSLAIHAEPVAWITGRKDLLAACFGLLALMAHSRASDAGRGTRRQLFLAGSFTFFVLALFSKISSVVLPGVLFLLEVFQPCLRGQEVAGRPFPWNRLKASLPAVLPHLAVSLVVCRWYYGVIGQFGILDRGYTAGPLQHVWNLLMIDPLVLLRYVQLVFAPYNLALFYSWPCLLPGFTSLHILVAVGVMTAVTGLVAWLLARRRDLAFYLLSFLVLLIPYLNIKYIGIWVANRYLYLSAFCLLAILVTLAVEVVRNGSKLAGSLAILAVAAFCSYNGFHQARHLAVWRNDETLWSHEMSQPNADPDVYYSLAAHYYAVGTKVTAEARELWFQKAESVIARARSKFTLPSGELSGRLHSILFVEALISIVRNEPPGKQLAALKVVEQLNPKFNAVLWQLTVFHYNQALKETEESAKRAKAAEALSCYVRYLKVAFRTADSDARDRGIRKEFLSDFPFLGPQMEGLK